MTDRDFSERAETWIQEHEDEIVKELAAFVKIRSVSDQSQGTPGAPYGPGVREMLDYALMRGALSGFEVKDGDGHYGLIQYGDDDDTIGFIAHLDVVPEGDHWVYPPYGGVREGDFLIGRGSGDNKGSAVMGLYAMKLFKDLDVPLRHGIRLILGLSEETGMQDMRAYNENEKPCKLTLVSDAAFPVNYAQKGALTAHISVPAGDQIVSFHGGEVDNMVPPRCEATIRCACSDAKRFFPSPDFEVAQADGLLTVTAHGAAAHAAEPQRGKSAIHMLADALAASGLLSGDSQNAVSAISEITGDYHGCHVGIACEDEDTGKTTMVLGVARTESGEIAMHIDCRLSIKTDIETIAQTLTRAVEARGFALTYIAVTPPVYMPKDDPRVTLLQSVYREITGSDDQPYTMGGGTYSRCLENAVTFGPSFPGKHPNPEGLPEGHGGAHMPDENVHIPSLLRALLIYVRALVAIDEILP